MWLVICALPNHLFGDLNAALKQFAGEKYQVLQNQDSEPKTSTVFIRFSHYSDGECVQRWAHNNTLVTRSASSFSAIRGYGGE